MKKYFAVTWVPRNQFVKISRTNVIIVNSTTDDIAINAHNALRVFQQSFGNLHKNDIIQIQEQDADGNPIGEPIVPDDENITVPIKK